MAHIPTNQPHVTFVGAGPGAEDLITLRGLRALQEADVVLYAGSLVHPIHLQACPHAAHFDTASMPLEEQVQRMASAAQKGQKVVRLHTGDPALFGAINEQIKGLAAEQVSACIVPGVSSVFAAAAALGTELTCPEVSQSVILTRTPGRTPMPEKEQASAFAKTGATLVFFLSVGKIQELMQGLMQKGDLAPTTPAALVYRVSWPDERIIRATVATLAQKCQEAGIGRQALILVGEALGQQHTQSLLYNKDFSHGYRNTLPSEHFDGACALYAFTQKGLERAAEIARGLDVPASIYTTFTEIPAEQKKWLDSENISLHTLAAQSFDQHLSQHWQHFAAHIFIGATGIAVRKIAPLLQHKSIDPAVIACPDSGAHCISLTSGHLGGANRLCRRIARITGGQAVISTATDGQDILAFDELAAMHKGRIVNTEAIKSLNMALLHKKDIAFYGPKALFDTHYAHLEHMHFVTSLAQITAPCAVVWHEHDALQKEPLPATCTALYINPKALVLGMGCRKDMDVATFEAQVIDFLEKNHISPAQIQCFATCEVKAQEKALLSLSEKWQIPLEFYSVDNLDAVPVPNASTTVKEKIGTASVCEAAALLCAANISQGGHNTPTKPRLVVHKHTAKAMTLAVAQIPHGSTTQAKEKVVTVVGLGSGQAEHISPEVDRALRQCHVVAGYSKYIDFIKDRIQDKPIIQNGMMGEVARCTDTLQEAAKGKNVCMVCSGDPGILAMAGLLFELKARNEAFKDVTIKVLPGITAANLAAASLGAPLQNGFSLISLSDLLVPTAEVRQNISAVAQSALPVAIYNPAGKKRRALLAEALAIFKEQRGEDIWCAYVRHAARPNEEKWVGKLKDFPESDIDMSTLVLMGSERTVFHDNTLYEARGYVDKYLCTAD